MNSQLIEELRKQGLNEGIPLMDEDGLYYICNFLAETGCESMLEVGTAIGYSAIVFAESNTGLRILTLEKDEERHNRALENIAQSECAGNIEAICTDARKYQCDRMFDVILLDGPKAHNSELVNHYENNLKDGGYFIVDDVYFHGYLDNPGVIRSRRLKSIVIKLARFRQELEANEKYETTYLEIGDGLLIAKKLGGKNK